MAYDPNKSPINQSRRPRLDMDDDWIVHFLSEIQIGHISTRDGKQPFINPTSFWYNKENREIYFHSNAYGRMRFNAEQNPEACFECFKSGRLLPSNLALEVSFQYECVIAYGKIHVIENIDEKRDVLNGLLQKYFGEMKSGKEYRPIIDEELKQTSVYGIKVDAWNGRRNWVDKADQAENGEWPDLAPKWFNFY
ncbi:MAG: pyridoxamine 5'-phosphate oxidase family protein [Candidatus Marinimicrobia bacterium]|jgi:nitroimidazol reductase NimA-like FMN-containing flavoprotein (pyridoxamine 5'-phosphate oxidase superfamily)|nr:pyridoxamine 5'-phosphate oxidase family protein [Candidatus Neomarinimicrobiota bacterium]MBT5748721.1 pyridoxamine 5'-phosphate oxidase family protein [Candidatus Neomarinimicrobiota bacterium]MBT7515949.1 pyridoxamine 5'-phosphate oxidase family protein [Candidatus Neomarinimicrobiota bacterium]